MSVPESTRRTKANRRRGRAKPPGLSRELIARTALELADREGVEGLTMRRVASELGVTAMSLYTYFRDKDELIDAVLDAGASEMTLPSEKGPWKRQMRALMWEIRRSVERHPIALRLRLARPIMTPGALRGPELGMRILTRAGFSDANAVSAWRALFSYTLGFASFSSEPGRAEARRHARLALAALPEEEFPTLSAASAEIAAAMGGDEQFEFGLARLLDGLEMACLPGHKLRTLDR